MPAPLSPPPQQPPREIAPFLKSMRAMLDAESPAVICWTPDGHAFEIRDVQALTKHVLPKYFKHAKYASFQRQLNYFHFRKWTKSKTEVCTFSNPHFQRDAPLLSWRILRKRSLSDASSSSAAASAKRTALSSSSADVSTANSPGPATVATVAGAEPVSGSSSSDSDIEHDVETALHWIDALFPSLEMLSSLGSDAADASGRKSKSRRARRTERRSAPMPAQSYENVCW